MKERKTKSSFANSVEQLIAIFRINGLFKITRTTLLRGTEFRDFLGGSNHKVVIFWTHSVNELSHNGNV